VVAFKSVAIPVGVVVIDAGTFTQFADLTNVSIPGCNHLRSHVSELLQAHIRDNRGRRRNGWRQRVQ
jgi:hypothetical protein